MAETVDVTGYYPLVKKLITRLDPKGSMEFHPGGSGGGGVWVLRLHDREARVPFRDGTPNALDALYEFQGKGAPLRADAFWLLVAMF